MRKSIALATLALASLTAVPAAAQDATPDAGPNWQGFHVEGLAGYDSARIGSNSDGAFVYGVGAGYDIQAGSLVLGIQAEAADSTNSGCTADIIVANDQLCVEAKRELSLGLRAGFLIGRNVLLYANAAYTNARFHLDYDDGTAAGTNDSTFNQNLDGSRIGLGAEFHLGGNAFIRAEGRYSNYEAGNDRGQAIAAFGFRF